MEFSKITIILVLYLSANLLALSRAQYSAGDDEDEYDEEAVEEVKVETEKTVTSAPVTKAPAKARPTKAAGSSSAAAAVTAAASSSSGSSAANNAAAAAPVRQATTRRPRPRPTTPEDFDEDDEEEATTVNPIMNPLSKLFDSVAVGNVTGIVDHALSIRAPAPVRAMVNTIMNGIFNIGGLISNTMANTFGGGGTPSPTAQKAVAPTMTPLTQQQLLQAQLYQQQLIAQAYQQQLHQYQQAAQVQQAAQANLLARPLQPVDPLLKYVTDTRSAVAQAQAKTVKSDSEKVKSKVKAKTIPPTKITGQSSLESNVDDDYNEIV